MLVEGARIAALIWRMRARLFVSIVRSVRLPSSTFGESAVSTFWLVFLGMVSGTAAGLLAGLIGFGGGVVIVPVVFYGLVEAGTPADQAAHIAVGTSLAAILPTALVSSWAHWRAGNTDIRFLREWGPGIATGVVVAQLAAPHVRGSVMTGIFALLCLTFAARFAFPSRFGPVLEQPPVGRFRSISSAATGLCSGLAGVGGGILTNIVMSLAGMPMHKSIGRASAAGVVVSFPATLVAAFASGASAPTRLGSIDIAVWVAIAPAQAAAAWFGARLAQHVAANNLSRIVAVALLATGAVMLRSSLTGQ